MNINPSEWVHLSPYLVLLGFVGAMVVALRFNLKTQRIVNQVHEVSLDEGCNWQFWKNYRHILLFIFKPNLLIESSDSQDLVKAKSELIDHAKMVRATVLYVCLFIIAGIAAAVAVPITVALFIHYR